MNKTADAYQMARLCRNGELTPLDVARIHIARLKAAEPETDAFLCFDEAKVLAQAESLTRSGPPPEGSGRLFGVPVAVKDNICVEGYPCTCGSKILHGFNPIYHATAVKRILAEGAVILGKTNMDEFGMGSSTEFSAVKPTRNPWDRARSPGGSSGGSAAAVASCAVPLALGTDTGGSIRQPASLCGVVGFKPTYGAMSRFGLVAFASSLDQIGPMAMTVRDAALLFQAMTGFDARDSTSIRDFMPDVMTRLPSGMEGMILGVPHEFFEAGLDGEIKKAVESTLNTLADRGADLKPISLPHMRFAVPAYYLASNSEASSNLARFEGVRYGPREDTDPLETMYENTRGQGFGPEVKRRIMLGTFALSEGYHDAYYMKALKVRRLIRRDFEKAFSEVDLIVGPTSPTQAFRLGERIDDPLAMYACDQLTIPASLAGIPGVSVPCGITSHGLPAGIQIMGPWRADARVLRAAYAVEEALSLSACSKLGREVREVEP